MEDGDDLLTSLPEEIRTNILSMLPTEDSVRTSVLSRKWENIWKYVSNLHFDDIDRYGNHAYFIGFIYHTLMNSECKLLNSFHLSCSISIHHRHVETWVKTAMKRQVQNLIIFYENEDMVFSGRFLTCESFRTLQLTGAMTLKVSPMIYFPNLTNLTLYRIRFLNEGINHMEELVLNFPALRVFYVNRCIWHHVKGIRICATEMLDFKVRWCIYDCECCEAKKDFQIQMVGCLNFITRGFMMENVSLSKPEVVVDAEFGQRLEYNVQENLEWIRKSCKRVATLLSTFSNLSTLKLSTDIIEASAREGSQFSYPLLGKVKKLTVDGGFQMITWYGAFMKLLHSLPKLEVLLFHMTPDFWYPHPDQHEAFALPNCISSSLEKISFENFGASTNELLLVKVFLEHGLVLKQVSIATSFFNKAILEYELLSMLKASEEASIEVKWFRSRRRRNA